MIDTQSDTATSAPSLTQMETINNPSYLPDLTASTSSAHSSGLSKWNNTYSAAAAAYYTTTTDSYYRNLSYPQNHFNPSAYWLQHLGSNAGDNSNPSWSSSSVTSRPINNPPSGYYPNLLPGFPGTASLSAPTSSSSSSSSSNSSTPPQSITNTANMAEIKDLLPPPASNSSPYLLNNSAASMHTQLVNAYQCYTNNYNAQAYPITPSKDLSSAKTVTTEVIKQEAKQIEMISPINAGRKSATNKQLEHLNLSKKRSIDSVENDEESVEDVHEGEMDDEDRQLENTSHNESDEEEDESGEMNSSNRNTTSSETSASLSPNNQNNYVWGGTNENLGTYNDFNDRADLKYNKWSSKNASASGNGGGKQNKKGVACPGKNSISLKL